MDNSLGGVADQISTKIDSFTIHPGYPFPVQFTLPTYRRYKVQKMDQQQGISTAQSLKVSGSQRYRLYSKT